MFKHSLPSIEQFAAYLDGNLSQNEMQQFSQLAEHDSVLNQLLDASDAVDDTMAGFSDADLQLPNEIIGSDFELPNVDKVDFFSLAADSFSNSDHLYQQEDKNVYHQHGELHSSLVDEIFDDLYNNVDDNDLSEDFDFNDDIDDIFEELDL